MLIAFNKPFGVLTQFTDPNGRPTLKDFIALPDVYAAGRLDFDSEGLLLLTDDGALVKRLSDPRCKTEKTYLAQVEGSPNGDALGRLRAGITLNDGPARALKAELIGADPAWLWPRTPPIRTRLAIPTHWLTLSLTEGRNRQVRRMTAHVRLPTLRLIRTQIGAIELSGLAPGSWREINYHELN